MPATEGVLVSVQVFLGKGILNSWNKLQNLKQERKTL
jgi:hypothetical protein